MFKILTPAVGKNVLALPDLCLSCLLMHLVDTGKDVTGQCEFFGLRWGNET